MQVILVTVIRGSHIFILQQNPLKSGNAGRNFWAVGRASDEAIPYGSS